MFWGLTIEPGKHYSQTVDQSFHVSMAALDTREKSGITQLLVRHEKAEFLLCTLQYGDGIPYPCLQQSLNLNLSEGSEISFYSEGKGTIHLTGYLVMDEPVMEDPGLIAEANSLLNCSDEEEDYDSDEDDEEEEEEDEEYSDSDMESTSSQDTSLNWQQLINEFDGEDEDNDEDEWTPESAKKSAKKAGKKKKRKSQDDSMSDDLSLSAYKKKRKAAVQAETLSKMEIAADEGADDDEEDEEEEDDDFNPADDLEGEDDDDDEDDEDDDEDDDEEDEEEEEEEEEEKPKSSPKKKAQTPKSKNVKSPSTSPQKATRGEKGDTESQETSESPLKKKKKKKKQQVKQEEESKGEGDLPLKNLKTSNKENIEVQEKDKSVKKEQTPAKSKTLKKIKLPSGTTVEDIKGGEGKLAKPGKKVFMYYRGVLANNQKEFDSQLSGKPFMFCLGKGEVIKGWDAGIIGMKVGGKRRLTVPPSQAYGSQKVGPIPPNSTLIFDVELKSVR